MAKTYKRLYENLCSIENLNIAFRKAKKGKSKKLYIKKFEENLNKELMILKSELEFQTYKPKPLKRFIIRDPKTRVISASAFRDRVVHHAVCNILLPIFEKSFIFDSYANRKNKGTHKALKRFDYFKEKVSKNGRLLLNAKNNNQVCGYVLKADMRHYFDSVSHDIMIKIISRKVKDEKVIWLVKKILENHESKKYGKGMPLGNLTSQIFANIYLDELDKFVKHRLRAKYYIRYVDDFVILHQSKEMLQIYKEQIDEFLKTIKLELHAEKTKVYPLYHGTNFLGFRIFYYHKTPKKSNIRAFERKLKNMMKLYFYGKLPKEKIKESVDGWLSYASHGNTYKLRLKIKNQLNEI